MFEQEKPFAIISAAREWPTRPRRLNAREAAAVKLADVEARLGEVDVSAGADLIYELLGVIRKVPEPVVVGAARRPVGPAHTFWEPRPHFSTKRPFHAGYECSARTSDSVSSGGSRRVRHGCPAWKFP